MHIQFDLESGGDKKFWFNGNQEIYSQPAVVHSHVKEVVHNPHIPFLRANVSPVELQEHVSKIYAPH
ncbi:hypothetical protein QYM36_002139 [Artemia franciscana]|uniref:Uncharacterized protein n=1 Tax=Artemia franciscana TaxID=6661 RepID=A0AA88IBV6_ARTSF|nr:hypothetical protein QYM36_002139 [Artemia franciscana]